MREADREKDESDLQNPNHDPDHGTLNLDTVAKLSKGYRYVLEEIKKIQPPLPQVTVEVHNASVTARVPVKERGVHNLFTHAKDLLSFKRKQKDFDILKDINLIIHPGTMTLVLAPPGHSKSALLKLLAGQLQPTKGKVLWNGFDQAEGRQKGLRVEKLAQYVDQVDVHLPWLTVRETFQFAVDNAFHPAPYQSQALNFVHEHKVDMVLRQLGLEECENTIVGNELIRGEIF